MKVQDNNSVQDQSGNSHNHMLPAVNFQFLYRKKRNQEDAQIFNSKKKNIKEAMDDFLTRKSNLFDIDEEVEVTYEDGKTEFMQVDARQDWDMSWYFVFENQMICGDGYSCPFNGITSIATLSAWSNTK